MQPYDAILLLGFGGPEAAEEVMPFLRRVTAGRGIPDDRLEAVGQHYFLFGGRSPINDQNRELIAAIEEDLASAGIDLPVYWGNRNWDPYLADTLRQMADDGIRRAACFVTSAYSSYSGCRQYRENLADAVAEVGEQAPRLDRLRHYFNHPGFVEPMVDATLAALADLPDPVRHDAHVLFVTHSIPEAVLVGNRILLLSPHPGQVKGELNSNGRDTAEAGNGRKLSDRIHEMLFADRIEEQETVRHG